ncbi:uncharacterized protein LOC141537090 [Cotesia typhae]|uniref:uncharacterized protein LOC141537090 n=1 Tax=Cotesia typhae TaxID=2053667 RepID=UPI003D685204
MISVLSFIGMLLSVPAIDRGTGVKEADAIYTVLNEWNLIDCVKAFCFDTTATNTGISFSVCTLLKEKLGHDVLYLACRHHILEIISRNVTEIAWPVTNSPNVPIFKRLKYNWAKINTSKYDIRIEDDIITDVLHENRNNILEFTEDQFQHYQPRNDYKKLLELSYIFLGGIPKNGVKFKKPGAMHHARWLAKAIYCLKIYMFRNQFAISASDLRSLCEICVFIVKFYIKIWFNALTAIQAPNSDLELFKSLIKYKQIHPKIAEAALDKL